MPMLFKRCVGGWLWLCALSSPAAAQMKLGGTPELRRDAILELGSRNKGLLLPRVTAAAMAASPLDTAAAGMLVFNTADLSLYIKKQSGATPWTRVPDGTAYIQNQTAAAQAAGFSINGAGSLKALTVTDMAVNGGLLFTNGSGSVAQKAAQLVWDNSSDELGIGTADPAASLDVNGNFKLGASGTVLANLYKTASVTAAGTTIANGGAASVELTLGGIPLLKASDNVIVNPGTALPAGVVMGHARVTDPAAKKVTLYFININTLFGTDKTIPAQTYYVTVIQN